MTFCLDLVFSAPSQVKFDKPRNYDCEKDIQTAYAFENHGEPIRKLSSQAVIVNDSGSIKHICLAFQLEPLWKITILRLYLLLTN